MVGVVSPLLLIRLDGVGGVAQSAHGQGPPSRLASIDLSFRAGPSFMPSELVRCSSVSSGNPAPSMLWSRKFWTYSAQMSMLRRVTGSGGERTPTGVMSYEIRPTAS